jgi:predicted protein tyrosine phosphatase
MAAAKVYWIPGPWKGRLGILPRPRGGDWLADEIVAWRAAGVDVVVSLLEPQEEAELALDAEGAAAAAGGIELRPFPLPDRGVPSSPDAVADLTHDIVGALDAGKNVGVHCRQGIGRSGLIVGGVLVAAGQEVGEALKTIEASRGVVVPETAEQRRWINDFAEWLATVRAAQHRLAADGATRRR